MLASVSQLITVASVLAAASVAAQVPASASAAQLSIVDRQYVNSGLASNTNTGFGVPLTSTALLTVQYPGFVVSNGAAYTTNQTAPPAPIVYITPTNATLSTFTANRTYTLMCADASAIGQPFAAGAYRHALANSLTGTPGTGANSTFVLSGGNDITTYLGPAPPAGSGAHRYVWMLFAQGSTFTAPANLSMPTGGGRWNVTDYVRETGITLLAASFFTVEIGMATGVVVTTTAVSTGTAAAASSGFATSAMAGTITSGASMIASGASTAAAAATTRVSASHKVGASIASLVLALAGAMVFA